MDKDRTFLVTGGAGFIGSHCVDFFLKSYNESFFVNLDSFTYAANIDNISFALASSRYTLVRGNILDRELLTGLFEKHQFQGVFHFAAETHVDNSIHGPEMFVRTNVLGTQVLLDVARNFWMDSPFHVKSEFSSARFLNVSTDEVYGALDSEDAPFTEKSPYAPNNPYSASKAAADLLVRSYHKTYGLNSVTVNCSNNFGPRQHSEKLIPVIILKALSGEDIPLYGNGKNIRDWIYVEDYCKALDLVFQEAKNGETYNVGGSNELTNLELALKVLMILDSLHPAEKNNSYMKQIKFIDDRPGHDFRYAMDSSKIRRETRWQPESSFDERLEETVKYYLSRKISR